MAGSESSSDSSKPVESAFDRLESGRAALVQALTKYGTDGPELTKATLKRIQWLNETTVSPARTDAASALTHELDHFDDQWVPLAKYSGALLSALMVVLLRLAEQIRQTVKTEVQGPDSPANIIIDAVTTIRTALEGLGGATHDDIEALIDDALKRGLEAKARLEEGKQRRETLMASVLVATEEVAETAREASNLLIARLNLLVAFLFISDPTPKGADATPGWIETVGKSTINEIALKTTEELLKAVVPGVSIAMSILTISKDVREKRERIRQRRELVEQKAKAYRAPNATDDMSILVGQFEEDDKRIAEFLQLIDDFTKKLQSGPSSN
jgi:hypothetical protein